MQVITSVLRSRSLAARPQETKRAPRVQRDARKTKASQRSRPVQQLSLLRRLASHQGGTSAMTQLRHLAAGALLLASTALPHAAPPGYGIDEHLVQVGGRTYVEAVAHAPSPMHIE